MPPAAVTASLIRPTSGLAVRPEKPSDPPHFTPSTNSESGARVRSACEAIPTSSATSARPSSISSPRRLRAERADVGGFGDPGEQRRDLVGLAAEPDDQHAPGIGMAGERGEQCPGALEIVPELRAAEGMGEGMDAVDPAGVDRICARGDLPRGARDAADGGDHPDLIACADAPVRAGVTKETFRLRMRRVVALGAVGIGAAGGERGR